MSSNGTGKALTIKDFEKAWDLALPVGNSSHWSGGKPAYPPQGLTAAPDGLCAVLAKIENKWLLQTMSCSAIKATDLLICLSENNTGKNCYIQIYNVQQNGNDSKKAWLVSFMLCGRFNVWR